MTTLIPGQAGIPTIQELFVMLHLSRRESEIAHMVLAAKKNREIASELFISEKTVKFHLTNIYKKTPCKGRYEFMRKVLSLDDREWIIGFRKWKAQT